MLSNAEEYALYIASTINGTDDTAVFSKENLGISYQNIYIKLVDIDLMFNHYAFIVLRATKFSRSFKKFSNNRFPEKSDLVNSSVSDTTNSITIPADYLEARANNGQYKIPSVNSQSKIYY